MSDDKPAVLQDSEFTIQEGLTYRALRTGAIWLNKLFFGAIVLLVIWMLLGLTGQVEAGCVEGIDVVETANGTMDVEGETCSVFLSTTAKYLGAMAVISFILSIAFGMLGLTVGKNIVPVAKAADEVGAGETGPGGSGDHGADEGPAEERTKDDGDR